MGVCRVLVPLALVLATSMGFGQGSSAKQYGDLRDKGYEAQNAGKNEDAQKFFKSALEINGQDGQVWISYAQVSSKTGAFDEALRATQKVLELGGFGAKAKAVAYFERACIFAKKGDAKSAWANLDLAMSSGFRSLPQLQKEPRLEILHKDAKWEEVTATKDVAKMSRT